MPPVLVYKGIKKAREIKKTHEEEVRKKELASRGIRNAEVRHRERIEGLTTEAHVYRKSAKKPRRRKDPETGEIVEVSGNKKNDIVRVQKLNKELVALAAANEAFEYEEGDAKLLISNRPTPPDFPMGILFLALIKDAFDVVLGLSVFLLPLALVTTVPVMLILAFYFYNKLSGGWWKKRMISWLWKRYLLTLLIEMTPLLGIIVPATTILVLMAHFRETKVVQTLNAALETLHGNPDLRRALS